MENAAIIAFWIIFGWCWIGVNFPLVSVFLNGMLILFVSAIEIDKRLATKEDETQ